MVEDPLDRLQTHAERIATLAAYEQGNRRALLWVHAICGLTAGVQMALYGSAPTIEAALGSWSRLLMAALGVLGGAFLAVGLSRRPRSIPLEAVGLAFVGLWDFLMCAGLAYARFRQNSYHPIPLGHQAPTGYVSAYPISVYAALLALIVIHLLTLRRLMRSNRMETHG